MPFFLGALPSSCRSHTLSTNSLSLSHTHARIHNGRQALQGGQGKIETTCCASLVSYWALCQTGFAVYFTCYGSMLLGHGIHIHTYMGRYITDRCRLEVEKESCYCCGYLIFHLIYSVALRLISNILKDPKPLAPCR